MCRAYIFTIVPEDETKFNPFYDKPIDEIAQPLLNESPHEASWRRTKSDVLIELDWSKKTANIVWLLCSFSSTLL